LYNTGTDINVTCPWWCNLEVAVCDLKNAAVLQNPAPLNSKPSPEECDEDFSAILTGYIGWLAAISVLLKML
jgi:hypothetical protein